MPRPRQQASAPQLSPGQASYVIDRLISERRVSAGEVARIVSDMHREISDLEQRLQTLRAAGGGTGTGGGAAAPARRRGRPAGTGRRRGRPPGSGTGTGTGRRRGRPAKNAGAAAAGAAKGGARRGRPSKKGGSSLSPEQLASRQLQGRYLGLIRQIPAAKRAPFQKTAKERGREAAIKDLQDALKK